MSGARSMSSRGQSSALEGQGIGISRGRYLLLRALCSALADCRRRNECENAASGLVYRVGDRGDSHVEAQVDESLNLEEFVLAEPANRDPFQETHAAAQRHP